jgi:hypothetical protein
MENKGDIEIYDLIERLGVLSFDIRTVSLQRRKSTPDSVSVDYNVPIGELEFSPAWHVNIIMPNNFTVSCYKFKDDDKTTLFSTVLSRIKEHAIFQKEQALKKIYDLNEILAKLS